MKSITIRFGTQTFSKQFSDDTTVGQVVANASVKAFHGYGDNVRALIGGVEQDSNAVAPADSTITVETRCNSKAS